MKLDFALVVLKGAVERGDGTAYFGSTMNYAMWFQAARDRGLMLKSGKPSKLGLRAYQTQKLDKLPNQGRAYMWDWKVTD